MRGQLSPFLLLAAAACAIGLGMIPIASSQETPGGTTEMRENMTGAYGPWICDWNEAPEVSIRWRERTTRGATGFGGWYSNVRAAIAIPALNAGDVLSAEFQWNGTEGMRSGYRLFEIDLLGSSATTPLTTVVRHRDPESFEGYSSHPDSVEAGRHEWLHHINKVRLPYNVNVLTQLVATEVLRRLEVLESQAATIRAERACVLAELRRTAGVEAYASDANFILFRVATADQVFDGLKQRGILIKNLNGSHALLANCLRVTVGTPEENARFMSALAATLAA